MSMAGIPSPSTARSATPAIASYAKQAATAAGVNLSAYTRYVYAFPENACDWWGLGTVGGNPSQAWINGSLAKGVGHEMGHNLGLYHSRGLECGTTTLGSNCTTIDYGDTLDKMGIRPRRISTPSRRIGWAGWIPPLTPHSRCRRRHLQDCPL